MGNTIVIDSDILIDFFRKKQEVVVWFNENKNNFNFATTVINVFELYTGAYKSINTDKIIKDIEGFLNTIEIPDFKYVHTQLAGKQRAILEGEGLTIDIRDLFIGVIALTNNFKLKTNNKKHFDRIKGLILVD